MSLNRQAASSRRWNSPHRLRKRKRKCNNLIIGFFLRTFAITKNTEHTLIAVGAFPAFTTPLYPPQYCFGHLTNPWLKYQSESNDRKIKTEILKTGTNDAINS